MFYKFCVLSFYQALEACFNLSFDLNILDPPSKYSITYIKYIEFIL